MFESLTNFSFLEFTDYIFVNLESCNKAFYPTYNKYINQDMFFKKNIKYL